MKHHNCHAHAQSYASAILSSWLKEFVPASEYKSNLETPDGRSPPMDW